MSDDNTLIGQFAAALETDWLLAARPNQLPPPGAWTIWLMLAGRGFGKTRSGCEFVKAEVEAGRAKRIALVTRTAADGRDVIVEGESGILAISSPWAKPLYEPSKRRLTWPNGAIATLYSAQEADLLRGPQHDLALCDELASWENLDAWNMLMFGLRLGRHPRAVVMTTPRPIKIIRDLLAREGQDVAVTRGSSYENKANLAPAFFDEIVRRYEGTRLGRQEIEAELLEDVPGALWQRDWFDRDRVTETPADLVRCVVAIDPAVTSGEDSDETGIIVAGKDAEQRVYVLADKSGRYQPHEWAKIAVELYRQFRADHVVAETNNGGEMVAATLRQVDPNVAFKAVTASRGKVTRAEPVATLYEQGRVHHVGTFPKLEDQACEFTSDFDRRKAGYSPDHVDALCWAVSDLAVESVPGEGLLLYYERLAKESGTEGLVLGEDAAPAPDAPASKTLRLKAPDDFCGQLYLGDGTMLNVSPGQVVEVCADNVGALRARKFVALDPAPAKGSTQQLVEMFSQDP